MSQQFTYQQLYDMLQSNIKFMNEYKTKLYQLHNESEDLKGKIFELRQKNSKLPESINIKEIESNSTETELQNGKSTGKLYSDNKITGIKIEHWDEANSRGEKIGSKFYITVDLTKHNNMKEYSLEIQKICYFIKNNPRRHILGVHSYYQKETKFIIECFIPYAYTFKTSFTSFIIFLFFFIINF